MQQKRWLFIPIALLLSFLAYFCSMLVVPPPAAQAHAYVIGSDPVDGSTIGKVPGEVHIFFNAPISSISNAHIYSIQQGNLVEVNAGASHVATSNSQELITSIKTPDTQPEGSYEVIWTAVANNDGNTTYGIIGFDVGFSGTGVDGTTTLGPTSSNNLEGIHKLDTAAILSIIWEWMTIAALTFWIGLLVIEQFVLTGGRGSGIFSQARKRSYALEWLCLLVLLCSEVISLILRMVRLARTLPDLNVSLLFSIIPNTAYGTIWLLRILLIVMAMILLYLTHRHKAAPVTEPESEPITNFERLTTQDDITASPHETRDLIKNKQAVESEPPQRRHTAIWLALASLITLTFVFTSSVVQVLNPFMSAIVFDWLHLLAQGIWLGGFTYLAFVLLPLLSGAEFEYNTETLTFLLRRLTPILIAGMAIQLVCGLFLSEASISDAQQLINDPFGRTLLVQILLTLFTVGLSIYALYTIRPKLTHQALLLPVVKAELPTRRTRQSEIGSTQRLLKLTAKTMAVCGAIILLCSALESFFAPPIDFPNIKYSNQAQTQKNAPIDSQTRQIGDLTVTLQVLPGRIGYEHTVIVLITDNKGRPVTNAQVNLVTNMQLMNMGEGRISIPQGNPVYIATFDKRVAFNMAGLWNIKVGIQRPGQKTLTDTFKITLTG
ncbi:copper resistance CopC/CopD family protein [Dictyobacter formicarum]|uniref:CopC domain-containing protein n=1 Tax=Dictyobacter formicarum TaxID=2778368 RepID=A0ABQ3VTA6_9CHLR|nr:copper resistance protein CopC [Dictyobacter formicarum]GHO88971.1 hypothetical protein KSZ_69770 [Dictyobacter formicarum]